MKKFLALLMAALLLVTMAAASAEDAADSNGTFDKNFVGAVPVGDVLSFNVEFVEETLTGSTEAPNPALISVENHTVVESDDKTNAVAYTYSAPATYGSYVYKITEVAPANPGNVTYDTEPMYIVINYLKDKGVDVLSASVCSDPASGETDEATKKDDFTNEYAVGSFTVKKTVKGNASNTEDKFVVQVSFTAETTLDCVDLYYISSNAAADAEPTRITTINTLSTTAATANITIGDGETITFTNIPVGVSVAVTELNQDNYTDLNNYTATYTNNEFTVSADTVEAAEIVNTKEVEIPTGVNMDTVPYIVLLAVAVLGIAAFIVKRRMAAADED